jgi:hypothetical protein
MEQKKVQGGWTYSPPLVTQRGVKTRIPIKDDEGYFRRVPSFTADDGTVVESHWSRGTLVPGVNGNKGVVIVRHFYGISECDFGQEICTTTEVIEKKRGDEVYTLINHRKTNDPVKFGINFKSKGSGIQVQGSTARVNFPPCST